MLFRILSASVRQKLVALQNFELLKNLLKINQNEWDILNFEVAESGRKDAGVAKKFFDPLIYIKI